MKDLVRGAVFFVLVLGLFVWAVQVLTWLVQEERTYRKQVRRDNQRRRYE